MELLGWLKISEHISIRRSIIFATLACFLSLSQPLKDCISPPHSARNFMQNTPQLSESICVGTFGVSQVNVMNEKGIFIFLILYNSATNASTSFTQTSNSFLYGVASPCLVSNFSPTPVKLFRNWNLWCLRLTTKQT
ncbi:hypothetical protein QL285_071821 [Trifolium repens]|nr:hypothetical protein QL285_071821 [Trifolium repens]